jgi:DHA1 family bicyclomycin/chloramphenicol resistance-like MFS transporter
MKNFIHPILYIIALTACCIEIDISVPSFPNLVVHFNTTESLAQHTVSINFLGFFISALVAGPLADAYGRRPIMIIGNAILMIGAIGCVWASTISTLLIARFVEGLGAATSAVVVFAMIADTYKGYKATQLIGLMNCVLTCLMAVSPIAGAYLNEAFGWRGSYTTVAFICVISWGLLVFALPETLAIKRSLDLKVLFTNTKKLLESKSFLQTSIAPSLLYAAYLSFITSASFLYMGTFKLSMHLYALHQALIVAVFALVSLFSGTILKYTGNSKCLSLGISLSGAGTFAFLLISIVCPSALLTTVTVSLFAIGFALIYPPIFTASLEFFPDIKGIATSLVMSKRAVIVAFATWTTGCFYNGTPTRIALIMAITVGAALLALIYSRKQKTRPKI